MPHRLNGRFVAIRHHARHILSVCKAPEHNAIFPKPALKQLRIGFGKVADGQDIAADQFSCSGAAYV